jgi:hypothetical protein
MGTNYLHLGGSHRQAEHYDRGGNGCGTHPPGGVHHNNRIPPDYTRVEVHTVKPEFMQWRIDYPTLGEQQLLREVMNQFILWHE